MILVKGLKKTYIMGKVSVPALKGISFEVGKGEFIAIMGKSGSGKSTLLHLLGLLDNPTDGNVYLDGEDIHLMKDWEKSHYRLTKMGYIFQEYALVAELTALENVYLPAMMLGSDHVGYKKKAIEVLQRVGLGDRLHHLPSELSGGQQQRVAIARALINNPKILFADEPTANLDTQMSAEIVDLLRELNRKYKQTIVMVTHELSIGKQADRTIWLKDGLITKKAYA
ncbi:MAG: ABC transporter ATP-binding protein [Nanoarchaeota archaeon]|nr:ABC transporter ATP-binding protein [Nanoarchaeota archaeon]